MSSVRSSSLRHPSTVVVVVADGAGVGAAPDAADFSTSRADTVGNAARAVGGLELPALRSFGLGELTDVAAPAGAPAPDVGDGVAFGRSLLTSAGNDTPTGHWEMFGVATSSAPVTFPDGFPVELVDALCAAWGVEAVLGNVACGGIEVLERFGAESLRSGFPIVYTSADSVLQVAAHVDRWSPDRLAEMCARARVCCGDRWPVGRIIARPFSGSPGGFVRESGFRRDLALEPPSATLLDVCVDAGVETVGVAKIGDVFAHRGLSVETHPRDLDATLASTLNEAARLSAGAGGLVVSNLAEFDYAGHARDPQRFAAALETLDVWLGSFFDSLPDDVALVVTADHGNDPTLVRNDVGDHLVDHTREFVPLLVSSPLLAGVAPVDLGDGPASRLAAGVASWLGVDPPPTAVRNECLESLFGAGS